MDLMQLLDNLSTKEIKDAPQAMDAFQPGSWLYNLRNYLSVGPNDPAQTGVNQGITADNIYGRGNFTPTQELYPGAPPGIGPMGAPSPYESQNVGSIASTPEQMDQARIISQMFLQKPQESAQGGAGAGGGGIAIPSLDRHYSVQGTPYPQFDLPEMQLASPDFTQYLNELNAAQPAPPEQSTQMERLAAILGGAARGAQGGFNLGEILAGAGAGAIGASSQLNERDKQAREAYDQRMQDFKLNKARAGLEVERSRVDTLNQQQRINFDYGMARYQHNLDQWKMSQPKIDSNTYTTTISAYNPETGRYDVNTIDNGVLRQELNARLQIAALGAEKKRDPGDKAILQLQQFADSKNPLVQATGLGGLAFRYGIVHNVLSQDEMTSLQRELNDSLLMLGQSGMDSQSITQEFELERARIIGAYMLKNPEVYKRMLDAVQKEGPAVIGAQ